MEKVREKTCALLMAIDELYNKVYHSYMCSKEEGTNKSSELRSLLRILDNVQDYLEHFKKFTEKDEPVVLDELIKSLNNGKENANCSGKVE